MFQNSKYIISLWLVLQVIVSSVGFTLIERKCLKAEADELTCCTPPPKTDIQSESSCCSKPTSATENASPEEHKATSPLSCCGDEEEKAHQCCSFNAAYHHIAFKNYSPSAKKYEIKPSHKATNFSLGQKTELAKWFALSTHAPPKLVLPPPKTSKTLLSLYAIFLI